MNFADKILKFAKTYANKSSEAPEWSPFGQWAWASYREGIPDEADTDFEKEVYKALQKHFGDHRNKRTGLSRPIASVLQMMMVVGWYKSILHAPVHKILYRGLHFNNKNKLANYLEIDPSVIDNFDHIDLKKPRAFSILNGHSTSWTYKKKITKDFSAEDKKSGYAVTLIADAKDNPYKFIAGPGGLYDVDGLSMYHLEKETVGLEPVFVRRVEWESL